MASLADALHYAETLHWPVFPCGRDKRPLIADNLAKATTNPAQVRTWWTRWPAAGIGFCPGSVGLMVLDEDSYKPGYDPAELARALEGAPPATPLWQSTPRGGTQKFYALAEGEEVRPSASRVAPCVDIRSAGSYVLLAPSETEDGRYTWGHGSGPMPKAAFRSAGMIAAAGRKRATAANQHEWLIPADLPANIEAAIRWLQSDACRPSVEGEGGDTTTYNTAAMLRSFGLSEGAAQDLLLTVYNAKCSPPWDADEIEVKVRNAYAYATSAPGNMTEAYRQALVQRLFHPAAKPLPSGNERVAGRFRLVDREGMEHIADPEWLIPDLLPVGAHAILFGPSGTYKTFLALDWCLSIATDPQPGRNWPEVTERGPVLYIAGEGRSGLKARVAAWEARFNGGAKALDFHLLDPVPLVSGGQAEWDAACDLALDASPEGYVLVVVDTATRALAGLNAGGQDVASTMTLMVQTLQARLNCAVLCIGHTGLGAEDRMLGSVVFGADADVSLSVRRSTKPRHVAVEMQKQKEGEVWEGPRYLRLEDEGGSMVPVALSAAERVVEDAPKSKDKPASEVFLPAALDFVICMVLKENPLRAWSTPDLAEALALREEIDVSSLVLRKRLVQVRETKGLMSARLYEPSTKRWRWKNSDGANNSKVLARAKP